MIGMTSWPTKIKELNLTKEPTVKELSSFEHIDTAVMDRVKPDTEPRSEEREKASKEGRTFIAGFDLLDPVKEKAVLDAIVTKRNESILGFLKDREAVRDKLDKIGIKPLAVVPSKAWADICHKSGMVVMQPDGQGRVTVSYDGIRGYGTCSDFMKAMRDDYASVIRALFPTTPSQGVKASVVLPTPPADVAETLMKAKSLSLHVAAVPEAVKFVQTPEELYKCTEHPRDEWARRQGYADYKDWVKRDPIVFHNHGTASAIIAQFGDFPIEKEVVDLVMAGDNLIPESPAQTTIQGMSRQDMAEAYQRYAQQRAAIQQQVQVFGSGGTGGALLGGLLNQQNRNY